MALAEGRLRELALESRPVRSPATSWTGFISSDAEAAS